ncbi:MAG: hypothetical protein FWC27_06780 [Firmicutes bacterium]|nr:hypothetical protein [Bacillota bacterium]
MSKEFGKNVRGGPPETEKFDMGLPPLKQQMHLMPLVWAGSYVMKWIHLGRLKKVGMKGVKPPYLLLLNHNAFYDFYIMSAAISPRRGYFPAAVDDYIGREKVLRGLGTIPKRKFTADITLVRLCKKLLDRGGIVGLYAEARYSLCGVTELIPDAVGKLVKRMNVPVVTFKVCGHHIYDPFWGDGHKRWVMPVEAVMTRIYTPEEVRAATVDEINAKIREYLYNDDFRWQSEKRVRISYGKRAECLHKVLYQCPHCMKEYEMDSKGAKVFCKACGKSWTLSEYGELSADEGETEFRFPTDWYKWEREQVRAEVRGGEYSFDCAVDVNDLPNSKGFVHMGRGRLVHDMEGFRLTGTRDWDGTPFEMTLPAAGQIAIHVEYNYRFGNKRDCIDMNSIDDTWYVFPEGQPFSVTKVSLATEEIYEYLREKQH